MSPLDLILFEHRTAWVAKGVASGIRGFMSDWENRGKELRQAGADTEINLGTPAELAEIAAVAGAEPWCRVNGYGPWTAGEVELSLAHGARLVLLPMVRQPREVAAFLDLLNGRAQAGILIETEEACSHLRGLAQMPVDAVYVGLNDLAISRGERFIFSPLADGRLERIRTAFPHTRFGFGGVTTLDRGHPLPAALLLQEMARLECSFSFLRRSFRRDIVNRDWREELDTIAAYWTQLRQRTAEQAALDHRLLRETVTRLAHTNPPLPVPS